MMHSVLVYLFMYAFHCSSRRNGAVLGFSRGGVGGNYVVAPSRVSETMLVRLQVMVRSRQQPDICGQAPSQYDQGVVGLV